VADRLEFADRIIDRKNGKVLYFNGEGVKFLCNSDGKNDEETPLCPDLSLSRYNYLVFILSEPDTPYM